MLCARRSDFRQSAPGWEHLDVETKFLPRRFYVRSVPFGVIDKQNTARSQVGEKRLDALFAGLRPRRSVEEDEVEATLDGRQVEGNLRLERNSPNQN